MHKFGRRNYLGKELWLPWEVSSLCQSCCRSKFVFDTLFLILVENCSSSFAIAAANAISDRLCMITGQNVRLSPQHFLSCQEDAEGNECKGGSIASFLDFAKKKGVVDENCFAYQGEENVACPSTIEQCQKYFINDYCVANGVEGIKREILKHGPVIAYIPVFRDFLV